MALPGFYVDNENRAYPLVSRTTDTGDGSGTIADLPNSAIVDAGFIFGVLTYFDPSAHSVWLHEVRRTGSVVEFEFRTNVPSLENESLVFTREITESRFATEYVSLDEPLPDFSLSQTVGECPYDARWSGFIVTGRMDYLADALPDGETFDGSDMSATVEPTKLRSLANTYVRTMSFANGDRTRAESPEGCRDFCWPMDTGAIFIRAECLTGALRFKEGYNVAILQSTADNSLTFEAGVGAGSGEPCEEVELFHDEPILAGASHYDGTVSCADVLRSINGIGGQILSLSGANGVTVTPVPDQHRIIIDVDMSGLAVCYDSEPVVAPEDPADPNPGEPCACGPE